MVVLPMSASLIIFFFNIIMADSPSKLLPVNLFRRPRDSRPGRFSSPKRATKAFPARSPRQGGSARRTGRRRGSRTFPPIPETERFEFFRDFFNLGIESGLTCDRNRRSRRTNVSSRSWRKRECKSSSVVSPA